MQNPFDRDTAEVPERDKELHAIRVVRAFMKKSDEYREPHVEIARKSREIYENWSPASRSIVQRANLKLPFGFTIIETQTPQIIDIFFFAQITFHRQSLNAKFFQFLNFFFR